MTTEVSISKEQNRAQQYLDVAGVMIVFLDKNGKIDLINKKGCQILDYDEDECLHQNWFDLCIPDDIRKDVVGVFYELMSGNIDLVEYYENPIITKSGQQKIIAFHNTLIMDDNSNIIGILFSGEDITERKRVEDELKKFNEIAVDRELRMVELKKEINTILLDSGKKPRYVISE